MGFVHWREGRFQLALETFGALIPQNLSMNLESVPHLTHVCRQYLETLGEVMLYERDYRSRIDIYRSTKGEEAIEILRLLQYGDEDSYLARIAILQVNHAVGKNTELNHIQELFDEIYAMEEWAAAALITQLMFYISCRDGVNAMFKTIPMLWQRRYRNQMMKIFGTLIHCALGKKFPFVLKLLNARSLMNILVALVEIRYRWKRWKWEQNFMLGRLSLE